MTLNRLRFLASTIEAYVKDCQELLSKTDPEIYGDYYRNQISESRQHLYQINRLIQEFERDTAYLETCLKLNPINNYGMD